jgi:hypothetical protein
MARSLALACRKHALRLRLLRSQPGQLRLTTRLAPRVTDHIVAKHLAHHRPTRLSSTPLLPRLSQILASIAKQDQAPARDQAPSSSQPAAKAKKPKAAASPSKPKPSKADAAPKRSSKQPEPEPSASGSEDAAASDSEEEAAPKRKKQKPAPAKQQAKKRSKASAASDEEEDFDAAPAKPAKKREYSKKVERLKKVCGRATIKIPPHVYMRNPDNASLEAALERMLEQEGLSINSDEKAIKVGGGWGGGQCCTAVHVGPAGVCNCCLRDLLCVECVIAGQQHQQHQQRLASGHSSSVALASSCCGDQ